MAKKAYRRKKQENYLSDVMDVAKLGIVSNVALAAINSTK